MKSPEHQRRRVSEYVELEAYGEKVKRAEKISSEKNYGSTHDVWDVQTNRNRYWVITEPTNLYSHKDFPSMDYALSFHIGLVLRMSERQRSGATEEDRWRTPKTWRQFEQAIDSLNEAVEAEDFQSVGVRCREVLITLVDELNTQAVASKDIKSADVKGQLSAAYDAFASGSSLANVRSYLKGAANTTWELVSWLTHYKNATSEDAQFVLDATGHLLLATVSIVIRNEKPSPRRCPHCKSYKVIADCRTELMDKVEHPYVDLCEACGWEGENPA